MATEIMPTQSKKHKQSNNYEVKGHVAFVNDNNNAVLSAKLEVTKYGINGSVKGHLLYQVVRFNEDVSELDVIFEGKKSLTVGADLSGSNNEKWEDKWIFSPQQSAKLKDPAFKPGIHFRCVKSNDSPGYWTNVSDAKDDIADVASIFESISTIVETSEDLLSGDGSVTKIDQDKIPG